MSFTLPKDVRLASHLDAPALRRLVNTAYKELADRGLNFTGTYQDEEKTIERMRGAEVYLLFREDDLLASITLEARPATEEDHACLYINQLAVHPNQKRRGLATYLLELAEARARSLCLEHLRLDTAIPATHLVEMYGRRGYRVISEVQWDGKTYRSFVMEKSLVNSASAVSRNGSARHQTIATTPPTN